MAILFAFTTLLIAAWAGPSLLTLSPTTYPITAVAHFVAFLASVALFILMGRVLKKKDRPRLKAGLGVGAVAAVIGTTIAQIIQHLPYAQKAFMAQLPGVPPQAAVTMLHLHALTGAVLSAIISAVLFGALGAIATWWGGLWRVSLEAPSKY